MSDETKQVGMCAICHRCSYDASELGNQCGREVKGSPGAKCIGKVIPHDGGDVSIDGDAIIAFIRSVKKLAYLLETLNVIEVKDAFIQGKRMDSVQKIMDLEKQWQECLSSIRRTYEDDMIFADKAKQNGREIIGVLKHTISIGDSPEFKHGLETLKELSAVCDNLAKHRDSGLLDLVAKIGVK